MRRLAESAASAAVRELLSITVRERLHTKGILTSRGFLSGSMNLTYSGLDLNEELITYDTDEQSLAVARLAFANYMEPP